MDDFLGLKIFTQDLPLLSPQKEVRQARREAELKRSALLFDKIGFWQLECLTDNNNPLYHILWERDPEWAGTLLWLLEQQVIFPCPDVDPEIMTSSLYELGPSVSELFTNTLENELIGGNKELDRLKKQYEKKTRTVKKLKQDQQRTHDSKISLQLEELTSEINRYSQKIWETYNKNENLLLSVESIALRIMAMYMERVNRVTTIPILPLSNYFIDVPTGRKNDAVEIIIRNLPLPSATTPWEAIIDYRNDSDTKKSLRALRKWVREISSKNLPANEIEEELRALIDEFSSYMRLHKLKADTEALQTLVKAPFEIVESLLRVKPSKIIDPLFAFRKRQISLMEAEINSPGKEIAYLIKTNEDFLEDV